MKRILLVLGLVIMSYSVSIAQNDSLNDSQIDRWKIVQSLSKDQKVVVETRDGKVIKGKFQSGDEQKMSVLKSGRPVEISKDNAKRVYIGKKKRSILGGVIGGLGGMFFLGGTVAAATRESDPGGYGGMAAGAVGLFGGSILGGKIGGKIRRAWLIYEAP